jgi:predicted DCC family thiol-disulfide oxidoreductase YuxK
VPTTGSLLIYDGDCGFCTTSADWIAARWQRGDAKAVPWQFLAPEELQSHGLTQNDLSSAVWWIDESGRPWRAHVAVGRALAAGHGWSSVAGRILLVPPFRWLAAVLYPLVARWRHRLPGGTPACRM